MKVSIITVAYNSAATIVDTVRSVMAQTYDNIEYIVIDGNSRDNTLEVLEPYRDFIDTLVSEPDKGLYDAMNKGIQKATGDIVGILNSDDFFTANDVVESVVNAFRQDASLEAVYADLHFVKEPDLKTNVRYFSSKMFAPWLFRFGFMPAHPTFYVKRECYTRYGLYDQSLRIAADYELLLRFLYCNRIKYKYLHKDLVTMRTGGVSTANVQSRWDGCKEEVKACLQNGVYTNIVMILMKYFYKILGLRWWTNFKK